jgi:hypothetical protein
MLIMGQVSWFEVRNMAKDGVGILPLFLYLVALCIPWIPITQRYVGPFRLPSALRPRRIPVCLWLTSHPHCRAFNVQDISIQYLMMQVETVSTFWLVILSSIIPVLGICIWAWRCRFTWKEVIYSLNGTSSRIFGLGQEGAQFAHP